MGRWESNASNCWQEDAAPCNSSIIYWHNSEVPIHYQGAFWQHWCGPVVWLCILLTFTHCYDLSVVSFSIISSSKISLFNFQYNCLSALEKTFTNESWHTTHSWAMFRLAFPPLLMEIQVVRKLRTFSLKPFQNMQLNDTQHTSLVFQSFGMSQLTLPSVEPTIPHTLLLHFLCQCWYDWLEQFAETKVQLHTQPNAQCVIKASRSHLNTKFF